jgi:hypothetical protein
MGGRVLSTRFEHGQGKHGPGRMSLLGLLAVALWLALPAPSGAAEKQPKPLKVEGLLTEVEPASLTIRDKRGNEVTIRPREDFTEKVAVGAEVTAWYYPKAGVNVLQWLEYPLESSFISPSQFGKDIKKIIILPSSQVADADGLFDAMASFLESKVGWYVAPRTLAEEIRRRAGSSSSTLDLIDPATGQVDLDKYAEAHHELIRRLASETRVDAVLEARVEQVQAIFRSQIASWDGVQEPIAGKASRVIGVLSIIPVEGHVPAATVVLKLWDPDAKLLWTNRRGFAVLAVRTGVGSKFRDRPIPEVLQNAESVQKWLGETFGSLLPPASPAQASAAKE